VHIEVVEDAQCVEHLIDRVLAIELAERGVAAVLDAEEHAEQPKFVQTATDSRVMLSGRAFTMMAIWPTPACRKPSRNSAKRRAALSGFGRKKLSSWKLKTRTP